MMKWRRDQEKAAAGEGEGEWGESILNAKHGTTGFMFSLMENVKQV